MHAGKGHPTRAQPMSRLAKPKLRNQKRGVVAVSVLFSGGVGGQGCCRDVTGTYGTVQIRRGRE
eukprot:1779777-Pleurochrysis_carterae.AAC.1